MKKRNRKPSIDEIKILAEKGNADAQYDLGWAFFSGESVKMDGDLALHWFQKSAIQGHPKGMWKVGCSFEGKDMEQAVCWYQKSADAGCSAAQWWLGVKYYRGEGVKKDIQLALHWFHKAAEQNDAFACQELGRVYAQGEYVDQNWEHSSYWYKKAADSFYEKMLQLNRDTLMSEV